MGRKEQLKYIEQLLSQPEIRDLAHDVQDGNKEIHELLQELYRRGFTDVPVWEDADKLFSRRVLEVQEVFSDKQESYSVSEGDWVMRELAEAEDPEQFACALGILAAELYGDETEKAAVRDCFSAHMEDGSGLKASSGELVRTLMGTGMSALFSGGYAADGLSGYLLGNVSAVLAMTSYVAIKRGFLPGIHPEVSLDAVSVLSRGLTGVLCETDGSSAEKTAFVSAALAARWMHVRDWGVLSGCMRSLPRLSGQVMGELLRPVLKTIAPEAAVKWKRLPVVKKDLRPLTALLNPWHAVQPRQDLQIDSGRITGRKAREEKTNSEL